MFVRSLPVLLYLTSLPRCQATNLFVPLLPVNTVVDGLRTGLVSEGQRQSAIQDLFQQNGCSITNEKVSKHHNNVICDLPGAGPEVIVVGAHFDFVSERGGKGMVDDWSGTSLLVSLFDTLKKSPRQHTFRFVAFAREEDGLLGSQEFVRELSADDRKKIKAFVNLECLGLAEPKVWGTRANRKLLIDLIDVSRAVHVPLEGISVDRVGDDDSHSFADRKIPVITIHSITQDTFHILHSRDDQLKVINDKFYFDAYRLVSFYLAYLDGVL